MSTSITATTSPGAALAGGAQDIWMGARRWRLWSALAFEDLRNTYRRSFIGALWITLSFAIFVAVKILIFGQMVGRIDNNYFGAYLLLGFFSWQFMSQVVNIGPSVFTAAENWIQNDPIELPVFVFQAVTRSVIDLVFTSIIVVIALSWFGYGGHSMSLWVIAAIAVYLVNAAWVMMLLGVICTRFRDLGHLVSAIMRVMFFLTPIFWLPSQMSDRVMAVLWWNPFAHFMWILRTPIIDQSLPLDSVVFVGFVTVAGCLGAWIAFSFARRRIVFWL